MIIKKNIAQLILFESWGSNIVNMWCQFSTHSSDMWNLFAQIYSINEPTGNNILVGEHPFGANSFSSLPCYPFILISFIHCSEWGWNGIMSIPLAKNCTTILFSFSMSDEWTNIEFMPIIFIAQNSRPRKQKSETCFSIWNMSFRLQFNNILFVFKLFLIFSVLS